MQIGSCTQTITSSTDDWGDARRRALVKCSSIYIQPSVIISMCDSLQSRTHSTMRGFRGDGTAVAFVLLSALMLVAAADAERAFTDHFLVQLREGTTGDAQQLALEHGFRSARKVRDNDLWSIHNDKNGFKLHIYSSACISTRHKPYKSIICIWVQDVLVKKTERYMYSSLYDMLRKFINLLLLLLNWWDFFLKPEILKECLQASFWNCCCCMLYICVNVDQEINKDEKNCIFSFFNLMILIGIKHLVIL